MVLLATKANYANIQSTKINKLKHCIFGGYKVKRMLSEMWESCTTSQGIRNVV